MHEPYGPCPDYIVKADAVLTTPRHYPLKLGYGTTVERIVLFATQAERLAAARLAPRHGEECV